MKNLVDILCWVLGLAGLGAGIYFFYRFAKTFSDRSSESQYLWYAIAGAVVFIVCGVIYFLRHVNKEEEIHITQ
jgi:hypothetical protein